MPPKRKQTPKNSFYYFMLEFKSQKGRQFNSMKDVADAAGPHWQKMSKEQKRPYEERALMEKNHVRAGKYTSDGVDVEELESEEKYEQTKNQQMKDDINYNLNIASTGGHIHEEMFFLIHINTFCYCQNLNKHFPAEIAIAGFNLEEGVLSENIFHRLIKPGPLPLGYASDATLHSKETHQIPPPMVGDNEDNVEEVYCDMKSFLSNKLCGSKRFPVLYAEEKILKVVQHVLDGWCYDFGEDKSLFKVYNLQYMFRVLRNTVAEHNMWPTDTYSVREIEKDVYAYAKDIPCDYHDVTNVPLHCSRSTVVRYAYIICDNCCGDLAIALKPGQHIPSTARTNVSRAGSLASLASSQRSSALKPTTRDDDTDSVMSFSSKSSWDDRSVASSDSSIFTLNSEDSFPILGKKTKEKGFKPFASVDTASTASGYSNRSYAGAMGTSGLSRRPAEMPSSLMNSLEKLEITSTQNTDDDFPSIGQGRPNKLRDGNGFPALGRGRGIPSMGRGRKPSD